MTPEEIYYALADKPFQPKRVFLKDGGTYDIPRRDLVVVGETYVDIGFQAPGKAPGIGAGKVSVAPEDIVRVETPSSVNHDKSIDGPGGRMTPEELYYALADKPFQPKRVYLKDGRTFDIPRRDMVVVGETYVHIGIQAPDCRPGIWAGFVTIAPGDILRLETLNLEGL